MRLIIAAIFMTAVCFALMPNMTFAQGISEMGGAYSNSASQYGLLGAQKSALSGVSNSLSGTKEKVDLSNADEDQVAAYKAGLNSNKYYLQAKQKEKAGKSLDAEKLYRMAAAYREQTWGTHDPAVGKIYEKIGDMARKRGALSEAEICYRKTLMQQISCYGQGSFETSMILSKIGGLYTQEKKYSDAINSFDQVYKLCERRLGSKHPETVMAAIALAMAYSDNKNDADAAELMKMYSELLDKGNECKDPQLLTVLNVYAESLRKMGSNEQADAVKDRADELKRTLESAKSNATKPSANKSDATKSTADLSKKK